MASASDRDSGVMHTSSGSSLNGRSIAGAAHLEANCFMCTSPTEKSAKRQAESNSLLTLMRFSAGSDAEYDRCKRRHEGGGRGERSNALRGTGNRGGREERSDRAIQLARRWCQLSHLCQLARRLGS